MKRREPITGQVPRLCMDMLEQPHVLIAGATGSGKSVLINNLIYTALFSSPSEKQFVLIDPKRVELVEYRTMPHTIRYASEPVDIVRALNITIGIMESRYKRMQKRGQRKSDESHIYVIVDEFADLMTTQKCETLPVLCRIAQLGRAAHIHLILATQRPTRDIINGQIKVNIDARLALRCPTAQDSRNIINEKGAETLPKHGKGYYLTPDTIHPELVDIAMVAPEEINKIIRYWNPKARRK